MLYTFLKFLGWGLLLALLGGCVGWALRALKCRSEVAHVRATTVDSDELDRMRHRLANMDQIVAERNRLRMQVADMRHADSPGVVLAPGETVHDADEPGSPPAAVDTAADVSDTAPDVIDTAPDVDETAPDVDERAGDLSFDQDGGDAGADDEAGGDASGDDAGADDAGADDGAGSGAALDLAAAASVLGKRIRLDDLSVVEGIGPKISELCRGIGIETWRQLADTDVATLQSMLDAAGSRFQVHRPASWPDQARLLAEGRWTEFKQLIDDLGGGR